MNPELDDAIDAVAREMTALEASASMRGVVLDRIARERQHAGFAGFDARRWAWAGVAAVLVIGLAAGLVLLRPGAGREVGTPQPGAAPTFAHAEPAAVTSQPVVAVPASAAAERVASRGPRPPVQRVQPEPRGLAADAGPAPLAGPDAIDIAPLGPDAITIPELGVTPLGEIQPLTITPAGPGQGEPQRRDER